MDIRFASIAKWAGNAYLPKDTLALTLRGTARWPTAKELKTPGETRTGVAPAKIRQILERIDQAMREVAREVELYVAQHPEFGEIGQRLLTEWEQGGATSLRA